MDSIRTTQLDSSVGTPPPLAFADATKARCAMCGHEAAWTGAIVIPECPNGHGQLTVVAMTGHTAEDAFRLAGEQLPDRVETLATAQQMRLPGTRTPFDFEAAMRSILEQRREVRAAQSVAEERSAAATRAKKRVTELQESLSTLEDEYAQRVDELDLEANLTPDQRADRRAAGCRWEERTGTKCPVCRGEQVAEVANARRGHVALVLADEATAVTPELLQRVTLDTCGLALDLDFCRALGIDELAAVKDWIGACAAAVDQGADVRSISVGTLVERPETFGRPHVVGVAGTCAECGAIVQPLAAQFGLEAFEPGQMVGVDCPGAEAPHAADWRLIQKLREAGADVETERIYGCTPKQREAAWTWAEEQIAANGDAEAGRHVSIKWPAHVSAAVYGDVEPARKPRPRHADPKARQTARNAARKAERQGKVAEKPAPPARGKASREAGKARTRGRR